MIRRGIPLLIAFVPLALAACGGDDAPTAGEATSATLPAGGTLPPGATVPGVTVPDLSDVSLPPSVSLPPGVTMPDLTEMSLPDLPEMAPSGNGSCSVEVTGDVTAAWSEDQNSGSGLVSDWFTEQQSEMLGDTFSLLFNCVGDGDNSFSLLSSNAADVEAIPRAPGTYEISGGAGLFGAEGDLWAVIIGLDGTDTNWNVDEPGGTLTITEFDDDAISFEFDAPLFDSLAEMAGTAAQTAHMKVSMTFTRG